MCDYKSANYKMGWVMGRLSLLVDREEFEVPDLNLLNEMFDTIGLQIEISFLAHCIETFGFECEIINDEIIVDNFGIIIIENNNIKKKIEMVCGIVCRHNN